MDDARSQLIQRQAKRYQFLHFVFVESGASELKHVPNSRIKQELGLDEVEFADIWHYLRGEDLLRLGRVGACAISHRGIVEMEESLIPQRSTEHFPSIVIQSFNGPVYGGVQGGGQENQQVVVVKPDTHE